MESKAPRVFFVAHMFSNFAFLSRSTFRGCLIDVDRDFSKKKRGNSEVKKPIKQVCSSEIC